MDITEVKRCNRCTQSKPVADFYWKHGRPEGWCKECYRDWHRERYTPKVPVSEHPNCVVCGKQYTPKQRRPTKFCSPYCRNQARIRAERAMREARIALLECEWCGGPMPISRGTRGRTKFCSDGCQEKALRARKTPAMRSAYRFKAKYGITLEERAAMLARQGGCAICKTMEPGSKGWAMDHDHSCCSSEGRDERTCGKCIRGVLCGRCNLAIGLFDDDPARLLAAARYVKRKRK